MPFLFAEASVLSTARGLNMNGSRDVPSCHVTQGKSFYIATTSHAVLRSVLRRVLPLLRVREVPCVKDTAHLWRKLSPSLASFLPADSGILALPEAWVPGKELAAKELVFM